MAKGIKNELARAYDKALKKLVNKYDNGETLEALNTAVCNVLEAKENGKEIENIEFYLFKAFKNARINIMKRGKRVNPVSDDMETIVDFDTELAKITLENQQHDTIDHQWLRTEIESRLTNEREKKVFKLFYIQGFTQKEIAEKEDVSRPMINKIINRINNKIGNMELRDIVVSDFACMANKDRHGIGNHISEKQLYNCKPSETIAISAEGYKPQVNLFDHEKNRSLLRSAHGSNRSQPMIDKGIERHIGCAFIDNFTLTVESKDYRLREVKDNGQQFRLVKHSADIYCKAHIYSRSTATLNRDKVVLKRDRQATLYINNQLKINAIWQEENRTYRALHISPYKQPKRLTGGMVHSIHGGTFIMVDKGKGIATKQNRHQNKRTRVILADMI